MDLGPVRKQSSEPDYGLTGVNATLAVRDTILLFDILVGAGWGT